MDGRMFASFVLATLMGCAAAPGSPGEPVDSPPREAADDPKITAAEIEAAIGTRMGEIENCYPPQPRPAVTYSGSSSGTSNIAATSSAISAARSSKAVVSTW